MKSAFIITLTGPSACGKGLITEAIIEYSKVVQQNGIDFYPFMFTKDVTRSYRFKEELSILNGERIDVNSVFTIPENDDLVYRTYGDEYALSTRTLTEALAANKSPIIVINDIRVVEELKKLYPRQVLSLFIFRHIIPDVEQHKKASADRGGVSAQKTLSRYEKAVALYRVFIENIHIFDRVILNVRENDIELAKLQARGVIDGVFNGKIKLEKTIHRGPKLFIVSGNAASGKDDIIKAAKSYGKHQADILIKSTSRQEEDGDVGEIICQYIPKTEKMEKYSIEYDSEIAEIEKNMTFHNFVEQNSRILLSNYIEYVLNGLSSVGSVAIDDEDTFISLLHGKLKSHISFEQYKHVEYNLAKQARLRNVLTKQQRFWQDLKEAQNNLKENEALSKENYYAILNEWFERNTSSSYIPLDDIRAHTAEQCELETKKIEDPNENKSWLINFEGNAYIFYENNELYGEPIKYGFEIGKYVTEWKKGTRDKHLVLTASLPNMFRICREQFGSENVVTAFTYSQISQAEHEAHSDLATGNAKSKEYNDIVRYAQHIADFDYALIYAETSLTNLSGNQKDELVDQMFRLFRVYNQ